MKFDTIIIGGGLSGLLCAIRLQSRGNNCAIISSGQNAMHFSSGSFELLCRNNDGETVEEPLETIDCLSDTHPYKKIGKAKVQQYSSEVCSIFNDAGVVLQGRTDKNSYMITPFGLVKPAWLALEDVTLLSSPEESIGKNILIVNLKGFLDFNVKFIEDYFEKKGSRCSIKVVDLPELDKMRTNPSEMRSVNIAKLMDRREILLSLVDKLKSLISDEDTLVLPSVFGLKNDEALEFIKKEIPIRTVFIGTMPPSIPGIRSQLKLKSYFRHLGGIILEGDSVVRTEIEGNRVQKIFTENFGTLHLEANQFVLATGSFFSKGLVATTDAIIEPLFGLDVDYVEGRGNWYDSKFFAHHAYLGFGVKTDNNFFTQKGGNKIENLRAVGAVLGGYNPIDLGCGAGVAIMSSLAVADAIINDKEEL